MAKAGIRTARAKAFDQPAEALAYVDHHDVPVVIKADGLAQGKGVLIAQTREEARCAIVDSMEKAVFGDAGKQVLIEQCLQGEELTIMAFTDGRTVAPMLPAQDHKRIGDGDTGLNTGGMGAYCPAPLGTSALRAQVTRDILQPIVDVMSRLGSPFQGVLYAGLMIVQEVPYVLEFNARMGDPETQVVLPLLKTDFLEVLEAVVEHRLDQVQVEWHDGHAVCVVMTSAGYPGPYRRRRTRFADWTALTRRARPFFMRELRHERGRTSSQRAGRVLGITGRGATLADAQAEAYRTAKQIAFKAMSLPTRHCVSCISLHA